MAEQIYSNKTNRRDFLRELAVLSGALALGSRIEASTDWSRQIGIQLTVVRDEVTKDLDSTLGRLAGIGYKVVNPSGFLGVDAKALRAMFDHHGFAVSHIDSAFSIGDDMNRDLDACQILGVKYAEPIVGRGGARSAGNAGGGSGNAAGAAVGRSGPGPAAGGVARAPVVPQTEEMAKRSAADYNSYGRAAKSRGMQVVFHNHVQHFELLAGSQTTWFDVFLSETDPEMVVVELDLGYTAIAGRKIPETIRQYPGRFPLWNIRDVFGIRGADVNPSATPNQRQLSTYNVPVGLGEIDFKTIFASAETAGLKYFVVAQDNSVTWGDSMAVAEISFRNLTKILT